MTPDLTLLRRRAVSVPGVARLADHHDDHHDDHDDRRTALGAVRVFDAHVEIDLVLAVGHSVPATTAALRAALGPLLDGRAVHTTVVDVEP